MIADSLSLSAPRPWTFHNPTRVHFGVDSRSEAAAIVGDGPVLIVATRRGRSQFEADALLAPVTARAGTIWFDNVQANPGLADFAMLADQATIDDVRSIIGFGGGSAMDSAKAISALIACRREKLSLRDIIDRPAILANLACPPIHALPTTSGTGAEVTPFATIWDHAARRKLSLAHPALYPATAIVDPTLTLALPEDVTIATALDALNQAFESAWNRNASPYTLRLAGLAIQQGMQALTALAANLTDLDARTRMAEASLLAGLCISQTRTAVCHSISYPLTAHFDLPHGIACAFTMKAVVADVLAERPDVIEQIAALAGYANAAAMIGHLDRILALPSVRRQWQAALTAPAAVKALAGEMVTPGRSDNFILPLDEARLLRLLDASLAQ